jgi:TIGR03009 family protein
MSYTLNLAVCGLVTGLLAASGPDLFAQSAAPRRPTARDSRAAAPIRQTAGPADSSQDTTGARRQRPPVEPLRIEQLPPELEQVLRDWEAKSSQFQRLRGNQHRITYDDTFGVEKHCDGEFTYEAPDKGSYKLEPSKIPENSVSRTKTRTGQPYTLQAGDTERWVCTGEFIVQINDKEKTYSVIEIPPENRGKNIIDGPLPFLFGMKAEQAKMRYFLKLLPGREGQVWLSVKPRRREDAANWREATVIIDDQTFLPFAVRLVDPSGQGTTVHTFSNIEVNKKKAWFGEDPLKPNLRGYKRTQPTGSAEAAGEATPGRVKLTRGRQSANEGGARNANANGAPPTQTAPQSP